MKKVIIGILIMIANSASIRAQEFLTSEVLTRVINIKVANKQGTGFFVENKSKAYIVTAKHIIGDSLKHKSTITIKVYHDNIWKDLTGTVLLHINPKIDIAIIESNLKISPNHFELSSNGIIIGETGYFLGFPFGLRMENIGGDMNPDFPLPFVKKASISAIIKKSGITLQFLDGHNNPGFSGGPVVFKNRTGKSKYQWSIIGVISGYINENKELTTPFQKLQYKENSGIILSYGAEHISEIIERK